MRFAVLAALMAACTPAVPESAAPPPEPGCVFLDAGFQEALTVQGYAMDPAQVFGQICWDEAGSLMSFQGSSLEVPIEEEWSYLLFFRADSAEYTTASLFGAVEYDAGTYTVPGARLELPLTASSSYRIDCDLQFNPDSGKADITVGNTTIEAQAQWL